MIGDCMEVCAMGDALGLDSGFKVQDSCVCLVLIAFMLAD